MLTGVYFSRAVQALKFGDYNVGRDGAILTVPSYMGFFLEFEGVEDIDLPILDIEEVNRLASAMSFEQKFDIAVP